MKNALIIHGAYGNPNENWIPWLRVELEEAGYDVSAPALPTPDGQNVYEWLFQVDQLNFNFNDETILIGHSIGATFLLTLLESYAVSKTVFVSGFMSDLDSEDFDEINCSFYKKEFNWDRIKKNAGEIILFHGDDDPYVSVDHAKELAKNLEIKPTIIKKGGHLNDAAGFTEFPEIFDMLSVSA